MDHRSQRRLDTALRLFRSEWHMSTSSFVRVPRLAVTSVRSGVLAWLLKSKEGPSSASDFESLHGIVASLGNLKGIAMKIGQHIGYVDSSVPDEVRAALSALQTHSQPMTFTSVIRILRDDLGAQAAYTLMASMEDQPIASASIGQVHRARLPDGTRVAVKVQYPGIAEAINSDFGPASVSAKLASWLYPKAERDGFFREARARVLEECDYEAEARNQIALAARYADHPTISIPAVQAAYSRGRVLTTTLVEGVHLDDLLATDPSQDERDRIGEALCDFYAGSFLRWGVLCGDPHPGNYLFCADGRVAVLDHGCTRTLADAGERARMAPVLEAADRAAAFRVAAELGGDALMFLRVRIGLASLLGQLGTRTAWPELVRRCTTPLVFDVVLLDAGERMIEILREVRDATGVGVREAKELIERTPRVVKRTTNHKEAAALKQRLEVSGGTVEIRSSLEPPADAK
jgi:predicted unusual protein kinase regulating ubiquinone biosynthesis (AarF/ABC1/UbiB family)